MRTLWHWLGKILVVFWKDISNGAQISWAHLKAIWWLKYLLLTIVAIVALAVWAQGARIAEDPNRFAKWLYTFLDDWAVTLGAAVTFMLAVAAFLAILDNRQGRRADRRERLLNEIIEWAIDVINWRSEAKSIFKEMAGITNDKQQQVHMHAHIVETKESFVGMGGRNQYISNIAEKFAKVLQEAVERLITDLEAYIEFLDDWQRVKADEIANNLDADYEYYTKADALASQIDESTIKVIEEATKIKTRDIS